MTDVGSAKKNMITKINKTRRKDINWISSHPIAGSEVSGPSNANENLFVNKWSVIIKQKNSSSVQMKKILNQFYTQLEEKLRSKFQKKTIHIFIYQAYLQK